ncbi:MAG: FAD:protein FMN transferase [Desulfobacterales bacterium]|nr:FAD:protein FMN transferase [Desulfobacterales bacterium]
MFKKWKWVLISVCALLLVLLGIRYYNLYRFHLEKQTRFMMDTYVTIYAVGPQGRSVEAVNAALDRMQEVDVKFNALNPVSPVYAFNHRGVPIADPEILEIVRLALQIARESDGAFDITVQPLIELWGFYGEARRLPEPGEIKASLENVGYRQLILADGKLEKRNPGLRIDLGGIAKGYAVKEAAAVLRAKGITSGLIDAGGDVFALGKKGPQLWKVGIRAPRGDKLLGYIEVEDLAVMGSGDYERFFIQDGRRYHHIFNPATGYPTQGVTATTLIHPDPVLADAWNTAIFILGPDKGLKLVEKMPGMEAIMVTEAGEILFTSGMKNALNTIQ